MSEALCFSGENKQILLQDLQNPKLIKKILDMVPSLPSMRRRNSINVFVLLNLQDLICNEQRKIRLFAIFSIPYFSFIGHSLGCVLIRAALASPLLSHLHSCLHTFLSFCGPHLGTLYSTSGLVSAGMWALQKLKKSRSLLQLRLRDHADPRETFMYYLSAAEGLDSFRHLLLVASPQDHYVPHHSSRIELCRAAVQDPSEMGEYSTHRLLVASSI